MPRILLGSQKSVGEGVWMGVGGQIGAYGIYTHTSLITYTNKIDL